MEPPPDPGYVDPGWRQVVLPVEEVISGNLNQSGVTMNSLSKKTPARLQRYRQRNRRVEFYPSPDVADIIAHHQSTGSETCIAGIIDGLIRAGHRAFVTGNSGKQL